MVLFVHFCDGVSSKRNLVSLCVPLLHPIVTVAMVKGGFIEIFHYSICTYAGIPQLLYNIVVVTMAA